ncbi:MAG TPA: tripartite tricarboxylate transporter substrate binding protein [Burkholderiales bacterium]
MLSSPLMAQDYPTRAVRMIVSFPPGTTPDIVARVVAPKLQKAFGQPFVVENRAGAGGNIAADVVAKSAADGYTLLVSTNAAVATNKVLFQKLPYDPEKDLETISLLATAPQALVVHQSVPVNDLKGFLAHMKANPGRLSYGSTGSGSASHLTMEVLKSREGVFIVHIPYRGFPQAVGDALSGNVQAMFAIIPAVLPHIKAEKMKALAVTGLKRSSLLPDVPSVQELGMPQLESLAWIGLLAPGNTSPEIVSRLAAAARAGLAEDDAKTLLSRAGFDIVGSTPTEFRAWQKAEIAKWGAVIRATGATPD